MMVTLKQYAKFMGVDVVYEFLIDVVDWGWGEDPALEFYVEHCVMYRNTGTSPRMVVTGEQLRVLGEVNKQKHCQDILDNAAEDYWTAVWSGA
jgi:hypothetical protein